VSYRRWVKSAAWQPVKPPAAAAVGAVDRSSRPHNSRVPGRHQTVLSRWVIGSACRRSHASNHFADACTIQRLTRPGAGRRGSTRSRRQVWSHRAAHMRGAAPPVLLCVSTTGDIHCARSYEPKRLQRLPRSWQPLMRPGRPWWAVRVCGTPVPRLMHSGRGTGCTSVGVTLIHPNLSRLCHPVRREGALQPQHRSSRDH
jgi:hypothetical protein